MVKITQLRATLRTKLYANFRQTLGQTYGTSGQLQDKLRANYGPNFGPTLGQTLGQLSGEDLREASFGPYILAKLGSNFFINFRPTSGLSLGQTFLRDNLAENSCGKCCRKMHIYLQTISEGNFQKVQFSRSYLIFHLGMLRTHS